MKGIHGYLCATLWSVSALAGETSDLANIRVIAEYIEAPHELVSEVMVSEHADSGPKLHARMRALVKEKKARIMETGIVTARSGEKALVESVAEYIFPSEYSPPGLPCGGSPPPLPKEKHGGRPGWPTAFETRNVGVTLEVEPTVEIHNKAIDLRIVPELVELLRLETCMEHRDQWGDGSIRMPTFGTLRMNTSNPLVPPPFGFVGLLTPHKKDGGRDFTRKIMLFVRVDVMLIENPDPSLP